MKWNPLCEKCVRECKQHASVTMVSCPAFKEGGRNMDLFDIKGNIKDAPKKRAARAGKKKKIQRMSRTCGPWNNRSHHT